MVSNFSVYCSYIWPKNNAITRKCPFVSSEIHNLCFQKAYQPIIIILISNCSHPMSSILISIMLGGSEKTQAGRRRRSRTIFISKLTHVFLETVLHICLDSNQILLHFRTARWEEKFHTWILPQTMLMITLC